MSDWSRKGPLPDIPGSGRRGSDRAGGFGGDRGDRRDGGGFNRSFDNVSEAGSERPHRRAGYDSAESKVPSGNWERKGPLTPAAPVVNVSRPTSHDGPRERKNSPAWGERSQEGSRPPRRERDFSERPPVDRTPTAPELDNAWRANMKPDPPAAPTVSSPSSSNKGLSVPSSPALRGAVPVPGPPASRPKLNLQKRTVSEAEPTPSPASATTDAKASPFGAAKPIDTSAREREIEEKRELALKQKREAEEKAREEKRLADEKAKEEKRLAKEAEKAAAPKEKTNGQAKEKENGTEVPSKKYEILRRAANDTEDVDVPEEDADTENANGVVTEDKSVKPREITRDIPKKPNGVESQPVASVEPSTEALQDDGWSTVSQPKKNRRGGNQTSRAIAS